MVSLGLGGSAGGESGRGGGGSLDISSTTGSVSGTIS